VDLSQDVADDEGCLGKINWTLRTFMIDELTDYEELADLRVRVGEAGFDGRG